jgi:N-acyl-D-aspartate/D-glutamate deacylase
LDLVLKNGRVVDGTGNPWFFGDVGIKEGVIAGVGRVDQEGRETIDVRGEVISPGFVDGHCHSDLMVLDNPHSEIKLQQGVTTEVVGNCGMTPAPFAPQNLDLLQSYVEPVLGRTEQEWSWETVERYVEALLGVEPSENVATYVGHGTLRIAVMGFEDRPASAEELDRMKSLLEEALRAGAIGLSLGLMYAPGNYTPREELAQLCSVLREYDGLLATHIWGEGNSLLPSIEEVVWIAERCEVHDWDNLLASTGWDSVYISSLSKGDDANLEGTNVAEISESRGTDPADCMMDLLLEQDGKVAIVFFHMAGADVDQVVRWARSLIASDSLHDQARKPHPRLYGTFPHVLARYVREKKLLTLEEAIRKMTSFPARRFKLGKRGLIAPGYAADLVVFDPEVISDRATYDDPKRFPEGISQVLVNGTKAIEHGVHQGTRAGTAIERSDT